MSAKPRRWRRPGLLGLVATLAAVALSAHIVPAERLHPVADSYRRIAFLLELNPVPWSDVVADAGTLADHLEATTGGDRIDFRSQAQRLVVRGGGAAEGEPVEPGVRREAARELFERSTRAVAATLNGHLAAARVALEDPTASARSLEEARQIWAAFEPVVRVADPEAFVRLGSCWLELQGALGRPGVLGVGAREADRAVFDHEAQELAEYIQTNYGERFAVTRSGLVPVPAHSPSFQRHNRIPRPLPPGSDINKQLPRPRQVLNMATRGVDESETRLIALGDMAFDSPFVFGEPARSLGISCNTCHNKSITNPGFFIPGLSTVAGGVDVSNSFFAPHANNAVFDPLDIPDLRGIRFTAPYGRNGRFGSLREFVRNVIVNEFNGPEPDPVVLDGMVAYMLEFDFLPNPVLAPDGRLADGATPAAKRGEELFHRPFPGMGERSCASCHVPSDHFLDRRRHDIGTVSGTGPGSRDRALDTPTLLSSLYTAPYFHDGRFASLAEVSEWFDRQFGLGLTETELADLVAYLETVGGGEEAYEDTIHTLEAEMEEFSFFLSAYEFLRLKEKPDLAGLTFDTIAFEIGAHKWDVQDPAYLPVLDRLAGLMSEARAALEAGDMAAVDRRVDEYRELYDANAEHLR